VLIGAMSCVLALSAAAPAAATDQLVDPCAVALPPGSVSVRAQPGEPQVSYARSAREILDLAGNRHGAVALGLTSARVGLSMEVVLHRAQARDGASSCTRAQLELVLSHAQMDVLVAREVEHDACVSALVLAHEMMHVRIERESLTLVAESLGARMRAHYREAVLPGDEAQAMAMLEREFDHRWAPVLAELLRAVDARHAEHDLRDSYGDKSACRGDLMRIARSVR
jgi:hypothetical protein